MLDIIVYPSLSVSHFMELWSHFMDKDDYIRFEKQWPISETNFYLKKKKSLGMF